MSRREEFVKKALEWVGTKENSSGHKELVKDYNKACDKGRKADIKTPWCALFVGAVAQETGNELKDGIGVPVDCSCGKMIDKAKSADIWVEDDGYAPNIGDIVIYDWADSGKGDDTTGHDHTGIVTKVSGKSFTVTEGNRKDSVSNRTMKVDGKYIRGFIAPKFADEVAPTPAPAPRGEQYKVTGVKTNLRVRSFSTLTASVIGRLAPEQIVTVYGTENGFARLEDCEVYANTTLTAKKHIDVGYTSLSYLSKI